MHAKAEKLLRVGELASAVGKSVRAVHLYEELGLVQPMTRTAGGFRLFHPDAIARISWIIKLQAIGFSLNEIQGFVQDFENAGTSRDATARVRSVFETKLAETRETLAQLQMLENDLVEALDYLEDCQTCAPVYAPTECGVCNHKGHEAGDAPALFAGLSAHAREDFDVGVEHLKGTKSNEEKN